MKGSKFLTILAAAACVASCVSTSRRPAPPASSRVVFLYQSNRQGELEPCGCQSKPFGGIHREANAIRRERQYGATVWYVDAGNLFGSEELRAGIAHQKRKAMALAKMLRAMKLDVFAPGKLDFDLGTETLRELEKVSGAKFIATNADSPFAKTWTETRDGVRYGFLAVSTGGSRPEEALDEHLPDLAKETDFLVLLSSLPTKENERLAAKYPSIKVVVGADSQVTLDDPFWFAGKTLMVDPHLYGYQLGRLAMELRLPFKGFFSEEAIAENQARLAQWRSRLAADPKNTLARQYIAKIEVQENVAPIAEGSRYDHALVSLDEANYGTENEITTMVKAYREEVRTRALAE